MGSRDLRYAETHVSLDISSRLYFAKDFFIQLSSVQLIARFPVNEGLQELSFEAEAVLQFSETNLNLGGVYSPSKTFPCSSWRR